MHPIEPTSVGPSQPPSSPLDVSKNCRTILIDQLEPGSATSPIRIPPPFIDQPRTGPGDNLLPVSTIPTDTIR